MRGLTGILRVCRVFVSCKIIWQAKNRIYIQALNFLVTMCIQLIIISYLYKYDFLAKFKFIILNKFIQNIVENNKLECL